ncbi:hypothetical protein A4R26_33540 [Niastella populi]|uniref:Peptidase S9 prolyl oligopeptidase catalytic domain-containing protein n=2 Tax=Niastella populi TaxID=550983 RepID=A0A1V9G624_9BACT|nr:hypothetical protein A4R26_33540 [Niastella populi]
MGYFTLDNKHAVLKTKNDSLLVWKLGSDLESSIPAVTSYTYTNNGKDEWIAYRTRNKEKHLFVRHLATSKEQVYPSAKEYLFSANGSTLFIKEELNNGGAKTECLLYVNLKTGKEKKIWQGTNSGNFVFDPSGNGLLFTIHKGEADNEIWYYNQNTESAVLKVNNQTTGIENNLIVTGTDLKFSKDGKNIFFKLQERLPKADPNAVKVDIWHYNEQLHSSQPTGPLKYLAVISNDQNTVIRLEKENERIIGQPDAHNEYIVVSDKANLRGQQFWNRNARYSVNLMSTKTGSRTIIRDTATSFNCKFSPDSQYFIYYDYQQKAYFSFDLQNHIAKNITRGIPFSLSNEELNDYDITLQHPVGLGGWVKQGEKLFPIIYDDYDVWVVDPAAEKLPVNLTNGYGRLHHIKFRLVFENDYGIEGKDVIYKKEKPILLTAFNTLSKDNGFFSARPERKGNPAKLTMEAYNYYQIKSQAYSTQSLLPPMQPVKALHKNVWVVRRSSGRESPNYFVTSDFKSFSPVSNIYPEKNYNWLTSELHQWQSLDGKTLQGILYKPENFDSTKKYPVIFHYYERLSDGLNIYTDPVASFGPINIPYFVSNGYLVFVPDIVYTIGEPGKSVVSSVVSAAKYLSKSPWIDSAKMGLQGHSFGGYETAYLVTHTNLFAAAAEANGHTDLISGYGALQGGGSARWHFEIYQFRTQSTLWKNPEIFIKNSPIFNVPNISTPLLIMHPKGDPIVPWSQAVEFFNALHRLSKKVWMLQYDEGGHGIGGKDAMDYTIRLTQFFDHYLKGTPAPKWMVSGVPARLKGIESGY